VREGETGFVPADDHFAEAVTELVRDRARLEAMRLKAREYALGCRWDAVFDRVYAGYEMVLKVEADVLSGRTASQKRSSPM
jgi:hypothetical protein